MAKPFGQDVLIVGNTYVLRDVTAQDKHQSPTHHPCKVRSVEVSEDGCIRVGVSFMGHSGWPDDVVDSDGYSSQVSCWCFPSTLRKA